MNCCSLPNVYGLEVCIRCPNNLSKNQIYRSGWVCPKCGSIYSPDTNSCYRCSPPLQPYCISYSYGVK